MARFRLVQADYREVPFTGDALAVYADPPYHGNEDRYRCKRVDLAELIPVMESTSSIRALSISEPMLPEALSLIDRPRVCCWFKHWPIPTSWPIKMWEPVVIWGAYPADPSGLDQMPTDSLLFPAGGENRPDFWSPKPDPFCDWVLDLILGSASAGYLVDLFSGSGSMSRAAIRRGISSIGVDTLSAPGGWRGDWQRPTNSFPPIEDQDPLEICPRAAADYPEWPYWWTNRHQWKAAYRGKLDGKGNTSRGTVPGLRCCTECREVRLATRCQVPIPPDWVEGLVVRRTMSVGNRQWVPIEAS